MNINEANEILNKYPHHNINMLMSCAHDPNIDKSHWTQTLWDIVIAVETVVKFQEEN